MPRLPRLWHLTVDMTLAWYWPASGQTARGTAIVPFVSGAVIPDWTTATLWPFSGASFQNPIVLASAATGTVGLSSAAPDGSGGVWAISYSGTFWHRLASSITLSAQMPSGRVYVDCAGAAAAGFVLGADATVYTSGGSLFGSWPVNNALNMATSGTTLAAILPASGIGLMSALTAATGRIALPAGMSVPSCMAIQAGQNVALGGWSTAATLSGAAAAALDPALVTTMGMVGNGYALLLTAPAASADAWTQSFALSSSIDNLNSCAWRPDGLQLLATAVSTGAVQALAYTAGTLSLAQTFSVTGACSIMIASTSINGLVAQSGQSSVAPIAFAASTWSSGTAITGMPGIVAVIGYGPTGAVTAYSGGLKFLTLSGSTWSVATSAALGFVPTALAVDQFLQVYVAGSGVLNVFSGTTMVGSGTWAGAAPTSIAIQSGRLVCAIPSDAQLRVFGLTAPGAWTQQASATIPGGTSVGLGLSATTLFAMGTGSTVTWGFSGTPYVLTPVLSGVLSQWNGSSWTSTSLGVGHKPSAVGFDASGDVVVVTSQNTLWTIGSGGSVISSGIVTQYGTQPQTVPMGPSAVLSSGSAIYVATSMAGVLVQVA